MTAPPRVRVVVVNFNGGELTQQCLQSLLATQWPADRLDVVLVDNASSDGVVARARVELPAVRVVEHATNVGFGRAVNVALTDLDGVDHVALVNPDACVDTGWLAPLVEALEGDHTLGAACPKVVFASRYRRVQLDVASPGSRARGGVRVTGARVDGVDVTTRLRFLDGFWGPGVRGRWTKDRSASMLVPWNTTSADSAAELDLAGCTATEVTLVADTARARYPVDPDGSVCAVPDSDDAQHYINSAGVTLGNDGFGIDRGYLQPDDGRFDVAEDVDAFSGSAVLLNGAFVRDVGGFDPRLFMYYEDIELSRRGQRRGWRFRYVPTSVVSHVHSASAVAGSPFVEFHNERNRLLVLARHAPLPDFVRAVIRSLLVTASYALHDLRAATGGSCAPEQGHARVRAAAIVSALRALPAMLRARRR